MFVSIQVYSGRGTFCRDDRQFLFHNVFVGDQAKALLKIMNKTKVSDGQCECVCVVCVVCVVCMVCV